MFGEQSVKATQEYVLLLQTHLLTGLLRGGLILFLNGAGLSIAAATNDPFLSQPGASSSCNGGLVDHRRSESIDLLICQGKERLKQGQTVQAQSELERAHEQAQQTGSPMEIIKTALLLAEIHQLHNDLEPAFKVLTDAYFIAQKHDEEVLGQHVLSALAAAYYNSGRFKLAEKYYLELIALAEKKGDSASLSVSYFNLAHAYASQGRYQQADSVFSKAYELSRSLNDAVGTAFTLKAWGENASAQNKLFLAEQRFTRALALFKEHANSQQQGAVLRHMGDVSVKAGRPKKAIDYYLVAIPILEAVHFERALLRSYRGLARAYALAEDFANAYHVQKKYIATLDSANQRDTAEATQRLQAEFETRFRTQKITDKNTQLALENRQHLQQLEYDRLWRDGLLIVALLALLSSSLLWLIWSKGKKHTATMERYASVDELTQIANRRAILEWGALEWKRAIQTGNRFSVLLMDIDHFKVINDTYGHGVGDEVLKGVVNRALTALRKTDKLGRYGGEEFLIIATEIELAQTLVLAERIRSAIAESRFYEINEHAVTVSIGVAQISSATSLNEAIQQADKALYEAKETGRNKVCQYLEEPVIRSVSSLSSN